MKNYHQLTSPVTPDTANDRMNEFFKDIADLRQKHGLPDVHVTVRQNVLTESGASVPGLCTVHYGDANFALQMCSYAMGMAQGESQKLILEARSQGMKLGAEVAIKEVKKLNRNLFKD
jgi:hypothetical protein